MLFFLIKDKPFYDIRTFTTYCIECECVCVYVVSHSVVSGSLQPHGLVAQQASLSMELSRQEYWGGLPFPYPGDLPDPGIKLESPLSPALHKSLLLSH